MAFVLAVALIIPAGAWLGAPLAWPLDLLGNVSAHVLPILALTAAWWTVRRYRRAAATAWLSVALLVWPLASGRAPGAALDPSGSGATARVLVFNALAGRRPMVDEISLVLESGADLVALVEPPDRLIDAIAGDTPLHREYPHTVFRAWNSGPPTSTQYLLSRWPLTRPDGGPLDETFRTVIEAVAHAPTGPIGVVVVHPFSPRTASRWRYGLDEAERAAACARRLAEAGMPVVVLGDLNATPSGLVSRRLAAMGGLRRCKPWCRADGTFPAGRPWPLRLALDDAMVSRGVSVASWRTLAPAGSDHRPVLIDLLINQESGARGQESGIRGQGSAPPPRTP